jgi:hypothetical protein
MPEGHALMLPTTAPGRASEGNPGLAPIDGRHASALPVAILAIGFESRRLEVDARSEQTAET